MAQETNMADIAQFERLYSEYQKAQQEYEEAVYSVLDGDEDLRCRLVILAGECAATHKAWIQEGARLAIGLLPLYDTSRYANLAPALLVQQ